MQIGLGVEYEIESEHGETDEETVDEEQIVHESEQDEETVHDDEIEDEVMDDDDDVEGENEESDDDKEDMFHLLYIINDIGASYDYCTVFRREYRKAIE